MFQLGRFRDGCHRRLLACPSPVSLDGWIRTSVARLPKPVDKAALPHPEKKWLVPSGQWLEKIGFVFLPHKCSSGFVLLATNRWPLTSAAMGPEGLEPSPRWLRAR